MSFPLNQGDNTPPPNNDGSGQGTFEGNINPAWNDVLGVIPADVHNQVLPHFSNWDKGVQDKLAQVRQEYEPLNPYKPFADSQISPDDLRMAYGLLQAVYSDPLKVIQAMQTSYGLDLSELTQKEKEALEPGQEEFARLSPQIQNELALLRRQSEVQGQILIKQRENEIAQREQAKLEKDLNDLRTKYGDYDEEFVLTLMLHGNYEPEAAVKRYLEHNNALLSSARKPTPPQLLGSGSGIPNNGVDPRKLNTGETKNLVVDILRAAAEARKQ